MTVLSSGLIILSLMGGLATADKSNVSCEVDTVSVCQKLHCSVFINSNETALWFFVVADDTCAILINTGSFKDCTVDGVNIQVTFLTETTLELQVLPGAGEEITLGLKVSLGDLQYGSRGTSLTVIDPTATPTPTACVRPTTSLWSDQTTTTKKTEISTTPLSATPDSNSPVTTPPPLTTDSGTTPSSYGGSVLLIMVLVLGCTIFCIL